MTVTLPSLLPSLAGQTGSGKTHTMEGDRAKECAPSYRADVGAGLVPRALQHIFEKLEVRFGDNDFETSLSKYKVLPFFFSFPHYFNILSDLYFII